MDNYIVKLVKETPNDMELGSKVREYVLRNNTCCIKPENKGHYYDVNNKEWPQCKKCKKLLI